MYMYIRNVVLCWNGYRLVNSALYDFVLFGWHILLLCCQFCFGRMWIGDILWCVFSFHSKLINLLSPVPYSQSQIVHSYSTRPGISSFWEGKAIIFILQSVLRCKFLKVHGELLEGTPRPRPGQWRPLSLWSPFTFNCRLALHIWVLIHPFVEFTTVAFA